MARLETEINQIYLVHPETKKSSLILHDEALTANVHLFVLAELVDLQKKSESQDLKKISEIILESFRANKKMGPESLFESALAQINQNLADLAHEGRKSWVGKFSCIIGLKAGDLIYLANNGSTSAWLLRGSELLEILKSEKRGTHPLKTFTNFTQGKLQDGDSAILTTSNVFNFVSMELFNRILSGSLLGQAAVEISKILKESMSPEEGFSSFFLSFGKKHLADAITQPAVSTPIYAPLAEEIEEPATHSWKLPGILAMPKFQIPKFNRPKLPRIKWEFFQNLSTSGKFFFISFSIFLLLFLGNLGVYIIKAHGRKVAGQINNTIQNLNNDLAAAQSALIYKNDAAAAKNLSSAQSDFNALQKLDPFRASGFSAELTNLKNEINKISVVADPKVLVDLKHHPIYLAQTSIGLLFGNLDSNSLSLYSGGNLTDYFLLNSLKQSITGVGYYASGGAGVVVASGNGIYHIDTGLKQFEPVININNAELTGLKTYSSGMYSLNPPANQVIKVAFTKNKFAATNINAGNLQDIRDFGLDKDIYLLYPDQIIKITNNQPQKFPLPALSEPISNATRIFVATNLYILEPSKKRVVILNKNGQLINQIYLPNAQNLSDLAVDESGRNLYLLEDNKLYKVTF